MDNFYDLELARIMEQLLFPTASDQTGARTQASMQEDAMLREALGKKKRRGAKGQARGTYTPIEFGDARHQAWAAESGMMPKLGSWAHLLGEDEDDRRRRLEQQRMWGIAQGEQLGMQQGPKIGWRR